MPQLPKNWRPSWRAIVSLGGYTKSAGDEPAWKRDYMKAKKDAIDKAERYKAQWEETMRRKSKESEAKTKTLVELIEDAKRAKKRMPKRNWKLMAIRMVELGRAKIARIKTNNPKAKKKKVSILKPYYRMLLRKLPPRIARRFKIHVVRRYKGVFIWIAMTGGLLNWTGRVSSVGVIRDKLKQWWTGVSQEEVKKAELRKEINQEMQKHKDEAREEYKAEHEKMRKEFESWKVAAEKKMKEIIEGAAATTTKAEAEEAPQTPTKED